MGRVASFAVGAAQIRSPTICGQRAARGINPPLWVNFLSVLKDYVRWGTALDAKTEKEEPAWLAAWWASEPRALTGLRSVAPISELFETGGRMPTCSLLPASGWKAAFGAGTNVPGVRPLNARVCIDHRNPGAPTA